MSESYIEIQLDHQPIELCKLLKIADLVSGGGEAKVVISEGYVLLNGEVEFQKRKKIYHNDIIEFNNETIQVVINENLCDDSLLTDDILESEPLIEDSKIKQHENCAHKATPKKNRQKKAVSSKEDTAKQNKRKPIAF